MKQIILCFDNSNQRKKLYKVKHYYCCEFIVDEDDSKILSHNGEEYLSVICPVCGRKLCSDLVEYNGGID